MISWIWTWLSFLVLILVRVKFFVIFRLDGSSIHQAELKLTLMRLLGNIVVLLIVEVFFVGVWESLLVFYLRFLKFRLLWLLSFIELYMLWRKLKRWGILMYGLNVDSALDCATFTVRTNVSWMLRNRWNICLNYCEKLRFRITHILHEENVCVDKLVNLKFIHRELFHWYNKLVFI